MEIIIEESGMVFKRDDQLIYRIEKSPAVNALQKVGKTEFVYDRGKNLEIVEAKSSIPMLNNALAQDPAKTRRSIKSIREKFQNTLSLLFSAKTNRQKRVLGEIPDCIKNKPFSTIGFKLYFVVKDMPDAVAMEWTLLMREELYSFLKCWNIPVVNFVAIGDKTARQLRLIE